jgi:hypothetical protein
MQGGVHTPQAPFAWICAPWLDTAAKELHSRCFNSLSSYVFISCTHPNRADPYCCQQNPRVIIRKRSDLSQNARRPHSDTHVNAPSASDKQTEQQLFFDKYFLHISNKTASELARKKSFLCCHQFAKDRRLSMAARFLPLLLFFAAVAHALDEVRSHWPRMHVDRWRG